MGEVKAEISESSSAYECVDFVGSATIPAGKAVYPAAPLGVVIL